MKSTRIKVLETILSNPHSTVNDIAYAVDLNGISVRHHLTSLMAEGLVKSEEERHGVGRPRLVYHLTESGKEKFPTSYFKLTSLILDQIKNSLPPETINQIFTNLAISMSADVREQAANLPLEGKLDLVKRKLAEEGFLVEWEKDGENYKIHEISCPYYHVGQKHPEICDVDKTMIASILSIPVEKISCVLGGSTHCTYILKNEEPVKQQI